VGGLLDGGEQLLWIEWIRRRMDGSLRYRFRRSTTWMEGQRGAATIDRWEVALVVEHALEGGMERGSG